MKASWLFTELTKGVIVHAIISSLGASLESRVTVATWGELPGFIVELHGEGEKLTRSPQGGAGY